MQPVSQIIQRNLQLCDSSNNALWINPDAEGCWREVEALSGALKLFTQDHGTFSHLDKAGADVLYSAFIPTDDAKYDWIIISQPRQKALLRMLLDNAVDLLAENGVLWLAGENKAGIKSCDKLLKSCFKQVRKLDNARHCTLYEAGSVSQGNIFDPHTHREKWILNCMQTELRVASYPGVFAHGRLDAGTALILQALNEIKLDGSVLDFACGAGIIGAFIAANNPDAAVSLLDTNALALKASEETFAANKLTATVLASDGLAGLTAKFDTIVSNPPIHASVKTDTSMSIRLLASVREHLNPGGTLIIVANVHLPYEKWLSREFRYCKCLMSNDSYKVLAASL